MKYEGMKPSDLAIALSSEGLDAFILHPSYFPSSLLSLWFFALSN